MDIVMDLLTVSSVQLLAILWECFGSHFQPKFSWDIHRKEMYFTIGFADNFFPRDKVCCGERILDRNKIGFGRSKREKKTILT